VEWHGAPIDLNVSGGGADAKPDFAFHHVGDHWVMVGPDGKPGVLPTGGLTLGREGDEVDGLNTGRDLDSSVSRRCVTVRPYPEGNGPVGLIFAHVGANLAEVSSTYFTTQREAKAIIARQQARVTELAARRAIDAR
jgi:hypothetical protein